MRNRVIPLGVLWALVMSTAAGRADAPVRGAADIEAALAESAKRVADPRELTARDELRLHLARLRLGMVEDCRVHPHVQGYQPSLPGYTCEVLHAPTAPELDARELAGGAVSASDELRFLVGICLRPHTPGYGGRPGVRFELLDRNCAIVADDLPPNAFVGLDDAETTELTALLRDASAAYAGKATRFENIGSRYYGSDAVADVARYTKEARTRRAAWDRELPAARPLFERLVAWRTRATEAKGSLQMDADDRSFCRDTVARTIADRIAESQAKSVSDLERAVRGDLVLGWSLEARGRCAEAGAFADGDLVSLAEQAFASLARVGRRAVTNDLSQFGFKVAPSSAKYGVVRRVSPSDAGFLVSFASVSDAREILVGCVDTDKFDRVERNGSTYSVKYQQRCRVGGVDTTVYGTAPVIVDESIAKVIKPGMVLVVRDELDFGAISKNGKATGKSFEPVKTLVEWLLPRGTQIDVSGNVAGTVVPLVAWGTPLSPRKVR